MIKHFMVTDLVTVAPDTGFQQVVDLMSHNRLSCIIVIEDCHPVGIITERDIVKTTQAYLFDKKHGSLDTVKSAELMSKQLILVNQDKSLSEALTICIKHKVRHLPVVDVKNSLLGIITYTDIANELLHVNSRLQEESLIDPLLKIGNRRSMDADLSTMHALSQRHDDNFSILMVDIDYFKKYNDQYGHQAGDVALVKVADTINKALRLSDKLYRYGGEEFLVLLPQTAEPGAELLAKRIRNNVFAENYEHSQSPFNFITVSIGIATYDEYMDAQDWQNIVNRADDALYRAKQAGRNRVES